MATINLVVDDLTPKDERGEYIPADETVTFGLDGESYEIDLSSDNAAELRAALADFIAAARKVRAAAPAAKAKPSKASRSDLAEVRAWAQAQGLKVSDRGRIPGEVLAAYDKRKSTPKPLAAVPDPAPAPTTSEVPQATFDDGGKSKKTKTG